MWSFQTKIFRKIENKDKPGEEEEQEKEEAHQ